MHILHGHTDCVRDIAYSRDGRMLASCSDDDTVRLWDAQTWEHVNTLQIDDVGDRGVWKKGLSTVAFSPDGRTIACGGHQIGAWLWNVASGSHITRLGTTTPHVSAVEFAGDSSYLAVGSWEVHPEPELGYPHQTVVELWDVRRQSVKSFLGGVGIVSAIAFSPDASLVAITKHRTLFLWNVSQMKLFHLTWPVDIDGKRIRAIDLGVRAAPTSIDFAPGGAALALAVDRQIRLMDMANDDAEHHILEGHDDTVTSICYTPDGRELLSGSVDETVRMWDAEPFGDWRGGGRGSLNWDEQGSLHWNIGPIHSVAVAPDGMTAAAGGAKDIVIWDLG